MLAQPNLRHVASLYLDSAGRLLLTPAAPAAEPLSATVPSAAAKPAESESPAPAARPTADPPQPAAEAPDAAAVQPTGGTTADGDTAVAEAALAKPPKPAPGPPRVRVGRWTVVTVAVEPAAGVASAYLDGRPAVCLGVARARRAEQWEHTCMLHWPSGIATSCSLARTHLCCHLARWYGS